MCREAFLQPNLNQRESQRHQTERFCSASGPAAHCGRRAPSPFHSSPASPFYGLNWCILPPAGQHQWQEQPLKAIKFLLESTCESPHSSRLNSITEVGATWGPFYSWVIETIERFSKVTELEISENNLELGSTQHWSLPAGLVLSYLLYPSAPYQTFSQHP